MIIKVDRTMCSGHAVCAMISGETLFPLDDDGFSIADGTEVSEDQAQQAFAGARACPERAIRLIDEETGAQINL